MKNLFEGIDKKMAVVGQMRGLEIELFLFSRKIWRLGSNL